MRFSCIPIFQKICRLLLPHYAAYTNHYCQYTAGAHFVTQPRMDCSPGRFPVFWQAVQERIGQLGPDSSWLFDWPLQLILCCKDISNA